MSKPDDELAERAALLWAGESLFAEATERCKRVDRCVEWDSITWRYLVPEADKALKKKGRCLCAEQCALHGPLSRPGA